MPNRNLSSSNHKFSAIVADITSGLKCVYASYLISKSWPASETLATPLHDAASDIAEFLAKQDPNVYRGIINYLQQFFYRQQPGKIKLKQVRGGLIKLIGEKYYAQLSIQTLEQLIRKFIMLAAKQPHGYLVYTGRDIKNLIRLSYPLANKRDLMVNKLQQGLASKTWRDSHDMEGLCYQPEVLFADTSIVKPNPYFDQIQLELKDLSPEQEDYNLTDWLQIFLETAKDLMQPSVLGLLSLSLLISLVRASQAAENLPAEPDNGDNQPFLGAFQIEVDQGETNLIFKPESAFNPADAQAVSSSSSLQQASKLLRQGNPKSAITILAQLMISKPSYTYKFLFEAVNHQFNPYAPEELVLELKFQTANYAEPANGSERAYMMLTKLFNTHLLGEHILTTGSKKYLQAFIDYGAYVDDYFRQQLQEKQPKLYKKYKKHLAKLPAVPSLQELTANVEKLETTELEVFQPYMQNIFNEIHEFYLKRIPVLMLFQQDLAQYLQENTLLLHKKFPQIDRWRYILARDRLNRCEQIEFSKDNIITECDPILLTDANLLNTLIDVINAIKAQLISNEQAEFFATEFAKIKHFNRLEVDFPKYQTLYTTLPIYNDVYVLEKVIILLDYLQTKPNIFSQAAVQGVKDELNKFFNFLPRRIQGPATVNESPLSAQIARVLKFLRELFANNNVLTDPLFLIMTSGLAIALLRKVYPLVLRYHLPREPRIAARANLSTVKPQESPLGKSSHKASSSQATPPVTNPNKSADAGSSSQDDQSKKKLDKQAFKRQRENEIRERLIKTIQSNVDISKNNLTTINNKIFKLETKVKANKNQATPAMPLQKPAKLINLMATVQAELANLENVYQSVPSGAPTLANRIISLQEDWKTKLAQLQKFDAIYEHIITSNQQPSSSGASTSTAPQLLGNNGLVENLDESYKQAWKQFQALNKRLHMSHKVVKTVVEPVSEIKKLQLSFAQLITQLQQALTQQPSKYETIKLEELLSNCEHRQQELTQLWQELQLNVQSSEPASENRTTTTSLKFFSHGSTRQFVFRQEIKAKLNPPPEEAELTPEQKNMFLVIYNYKSIPKEYDYLRNTQSSYYLPELLTARFTCEQHELLKKVYLYIHITRTLIQLCIIASDVNSSLNTDRADLTCIRNELVHLGLWLIENKSLQEFIDLYKNLVNYVISPTNFDFKQEKIGFFANVPRLEQLSTTELAQSLSLHWQTLDELIKALIILQPYFMEQKNYKDNYISYTLGCGIVLLATTAMLDMDKNLVGEQKPVSLIQFLRQARELRNIIAHENENEEFQTGFVQPVTEQQLSNVGLLANEAAEAISQYYMISPQEAETSSYARYSL